MKQIDLETLYLKADPEIPNNPALPVLVYKNVAGEEENRDKVFLRRFEENGWQGAWKNGIFAYHHFHSNAHEALGIASGTVKVKLGGESGKTLTLEAGDLLLLPAGTGHKRLSDTGDLVVVGAYPGGQENYDLCRSKADMSGSRDALQEVPCPATDPFYGEQGPLRQLWAKS